MKKFMGRKPLPPEIREKNRKARWRRAKDKRKANFAKLRLEIPLDLKAWLKVKGKNWAGGMTGVVIYTLQKLRASEGKK